VFGGCSRTTYFDHHQIFGLQLSLLEFSILRDVLDFPALYIRTFMVYLWRSRSGTAWNIFWLSPS
jgi:hypothetical protein